MRRGEGQHHLSLACAGRRVNAQREWLHYKYRNHPEHVRWVEQQGSVCRTGLLQNAGTPALVSSSSHQRHIYLVIAGLNQIKGVESSCVRVQAGVKLADLHDYLAKQVGREQAASCAAEHQR